MVQRFVARLASNDQPNTSKTVDTKASQVRILHRLRSETARMPAFSTATYDRNGTTEPSPPPEPPPSSAGVRNPPAVARMLRLMAL